ncbi:FAD:protein FMN transferase [Massilia sp. CF038]|uniref:FAD:protein FMN transferase n=1 Tax=Massilia sp. CF038 TaxID=1881045 RepID=UPI00091C42A0|nr:FAD:protein FMN transferase [Massilia sp. CF038]SHG52912.1 thiamine biosynthesis lipoprotein [Massilia sp. CF038]
MRRVLVPLTVSSGLPAAGSEVRQIGGTSMGTTWSARVVLEPGASREALAGELQHQLDQVVAEMSHWEPDSNLSRYNSASAGSWHTMPQAFCDVVSYALEVARISGGAYDPCAGALVNRWGFGARKRYDGPDFYAPADADLKAILARSDRERVQFDARERRILQPGGVQLDLSSVAKGHAVDRLAQHLETSGIDHYLVEAGGELRGAGMKPDGQPWWVTLEAVPGESANDAVVVALHGLAVATSGDYRRFYQHQGERASHTLDPRSGYPIDNGVASVTVLHRECMAADALSTALTVLGPDEGMRLAQAQGLAARFVLRTATGFQELGSTAFNELLQ